MLDLHPRCDCHECTQARARETAPLNYPPYIQVPFPTQPYLGTCWCGKTYPHTCAWC